MCFDYDGTCDAYSEKIRKARKTHKCVSCRQDIKSGEQYLFTSGVYDHTPFVEKLCNLCTQDRITIYELERSHGCNQMESWCPHKEVKEYIEQYNKSNQTSFESPIIGRACRFVDLHKLLESHATLERKRWELACAKREFTDCDKQGF